ncbi:hypothetical protein [uncultured Mediterranean phage]|nr:hypothetical protein [uncultured Mediterranean phage]
MKQLKQIWNKIDGKKTFIGGVMHAVWFLVNVIFKDLSTPSEAAYGHGIIGMLTGTGVIHKVKKINNAKANKTK